MLSPNLDKIVHSNFTKVRLTPLIPISIFFILLLIYFSWSTNELSFIENYILIQKNVFFVINENLSHASGLQNNLTELGDILILFPFLSIFIIYAPKFWEKLIVSSILALLMSVFLKKVFAVPRPAAVFDNNDFTIVGNALCGSSSLPSGHSIATFVVISTVLFAFLPKQKSAKLIWSLSLILLGLLISFSRVAVGAHYPLDVVIGCLIGFSAAIIGIKISNTFSWLIWFENKNTFPVLFTITAIWGLLIVKKMLLKDLAIYNLSLLSLMISQYIIILPYVKKYKIKPLYVNS
ncbi:phosphatase PAP2 family protein [Aquimarina latercula]|uniref:phosphatase PAP2 family protein n=1 Tax=Aquimarina latercula TaxID=987 RepID=UPI000423EABE|nr:phosphatase PAP2 family protein [Aquimarina latercula]